MHGQAEMAPETGQPGIGHHVAGQSARRVQSRHRHDVRAIPEPHGVQCRLTARLAPAVQRMCRQPHLHLRPQPAQRPLAGQYGGATLQGFANERGGIRISCIGGVRGCQQPVRRTRRMQSHAIACECFIDRFKPLRGFIGRQCDLTTRRQMNPADAGHHVQRRRQTDGIIDPQPRNTLRRDPRRRHGHRRPECTQHAVAPVAGTRHLPRGLQQPLQ
jgi:hypothetical protein